MEPYNPRRSTFAPHCRHASRPLRDCLATRRGRHGRGVSRARHRGSAATSRLRSCPQHSTDPDRLRRFEQEARATAALNHPNILAVFDVGMHDGAPYVVAELLYGDTLRERLSSGALSLKTAVDSAVQIVRGSPLPMRAASCIAI